MDHQTFAQLLGNYGEFVGAIAVVVTLAYLAAQIRQNSRVIRDNRNAVTAQASRDIDLYLARWHMEVARDKDLKQIAAHAISSHPDDWSDEEWNEWRVYALSLFLPYQSSYLNREMGVASDDYAVRRLAILRGLIDSNPAWRRFWELEPFDAGFRDAVESAQPLRSSIASKSR